MTDKKCLSSRIDFEEHAGVSYAVFYSMGVSIFRIPIIGELTAKRRRDITLRLAATLDACVYLLPVGDLGLVCYMCDRNRGIEHDPAVDVAEQCVDCKAELKNCGSFL